MSRQLIGYFSGVSIYFRHLPSGDVAVCHPHSDVVRSIVEPAYTDRGYREHQHNNWVIRKRFAQSVISTIGQCCDSIA